MLTRDIALAHLRATGKLSTESKPMDVISADELNLSPAVAIRDIVDRNVGRGKRCLAPSINHVVLP